MTEQIRKLVSFLEKEINHIYQKTAPVDTYWKDIILNMLSQSAETSSTVDNFKEHIQNLNYLPGAKWHASTIRTYQFALNYFQVIQACDAFEIAEKAQAALPLGKEPDPTKIELF